MLLHGLVLATTPMITCDIIEKLSKMAGNLPSSPLQN